MNNKERLKELIKKNPTDKKFIDSNNKIIEQRRIIDDHMRKSPMGELVEMQHLMNAKPDQFNPEGDYSLINFDEEEIYLSQTQSLAIKYMSDQHKKGRKSIFVHDILDACNTKHLSLHKLFKNKNVMGNLILRKKNNYYYLDL